MKSFKKEELDERIVGLQKKFGFEALFIVTGLLFIDFIYKVIYLKQGYFENIDLYFIMVAPWVYYKVRGLFGGAFDQKLKNKFLGRTAGFFAAGILVTVLLIAVSNDISSSKIHSNLSFYSGVASGLVVGTLVIIVIRYFAKKKQKKILDE